MFSNTPPHLRVLTSTFLFLLLLVVGSCEKEELVIVQEEALIEAENNFSKTTIESTTEFVSPARDAAIRHYFSDGKKSGKGISAIIDSILLDPAKFVRDPLNNHDVVTYLVDGKDSTKLHNLVFSFSGDTLKQALHYAFDLRAEFGGKLANGEASFDQYKGTVSINPANSIEEVLQKDGLGDCFNLSVVNGNVRFGTINVDPNVGGFGTGKPSGSSGPIGGTTYTGGESGSGDEDGGIITYVCYELVTNPLTNESFVWLINCVTGDRIGGPDAFTDSTDSSSEGKTAKNKKSDCGTFLNMLGIVARPGDLNVSLAENLRREKLLNGTGFQANETVSRILDFNKLLLCAGDRNDCVRAQLITYVNDELDAHFGESLHAGVSNTISDEHLIRIAETVYQSDVNNNTSLIRSVEFVLRNFSNELVTNNLGEILLQAAILHVNDPDNFTGNAAAYINIINKTNGELTTDDAIALVTNPEVLIPVSNFLDEVGYSEFSLNTIKLHAAELRNGVIADEVGSERWNNTIIQNESFFSSALDLEDLPNCCGTEDVYIPVGLLTIGTATQTAGEFAAWHEVRFEEEAALLKYVYPEKYPLNTRLNRLRLKLDVEYRVMSSSLHATLDLLGLIPGVGALPDLINGVWYTVEGDGLGATLSFSAAIPVVGLLAAGSRIVKWVKFGASGKRRLSWLRHSSTNEIFFYPFKVKSWRKFWHFPEGKVGHHMIPKAQSGHPLLQKAAKVTDPDVAPFHPHDLPNGYALDPARHIGSHPVYTQKIVDEMNRWNILNPNVSPEVAAVAIRSWQTRLTARLSSTTGSIDNIIVPRIPNP